MSTCAKCKLNFAKDLIAVCNICNDLYHASGTSNCAGLSATEIKVLQLKSKEPVLFYKCDNCRKDGKENPIVNLLLELRNKTNKLEEMKQEFNDFKANKLPNIEKDLDELIDKSSSMDDRIAKLENLIVSAEDTATVVAVGKNNIVNAPAINTFCQMKEFNLRQKKLNNIILYKVTEMITNNSYNHKEDVANIIKLLSKFDFKTTLSAKNIHRIGNFEINKSRPIRIKFDKRSDATKIVSNWQSLPKNIFVSFDFTLDQRTKYKTLRKETLLFNHNNKDANIYKVIRYSEGEPYIVIKDKINKNIIEEVNSTDTINSNNLNSQTG